MNTPLGRRTCVGSAPVVSAPTTRPISRCGGTNTNAGVRPSSGPTRATERRLVPTFPRRDSLHHGQRPEHRLRHRGEPRPGVERPRLKDLPAAGGSPASGASAKRRSTKDQRPPGDDDRNDIELPEKISEGRPSAEASEKALVRKPKIGDTMPVPSAPPPAAGRLEQRRPVGWQQAASTWRQGQRGRLGLQRWRRRSKPEGVAGQGRRA